MTATAAACIALGCTGSPEPVLPSLADYALSRAFSVQSLGVAQLETARRANYAAGPDAELHARLTAAQSVLLAAQAALYPLLNRAAA